jgi:hypothetical protein
MDTPGNVSPWRIKVTVEAQPTNNDDEIDYHNSKPSKKRKFATEVTKTTVPLKDADESRPSRERKKPRRSIGASTGIRKRKPTPARRKSDRKLDSTPILSDINVESSPTEKPRRIRRNSSHDLSQCGTTAEPTHDGEAGHLLEGLGDGQNTTVTLTPITKIPPKRVRRTAFDFSALTPLHQKHSFPPPETQSNFQELQEKHKQGRAGIVPKGWSAPVFSPLPPRSSPVRTQERSHQNAAAHNDVDHMDSPIFPSQDDDACDDDSLDDPGREADADKEGDTHDDAALWKKMIKQSDEFGDEQTATDGACETSSEDEDFVMAGEITSVVGDATMMQSEEFSMVSISSLPSAKNLHSGIVENSNVQPTRAKPTERRSKQSSPNSTSDAPVTTGDSNGKHSPELGNSQLTYEQLLDHLPSKEAPITAPTTTSKSTTTQVMLDASQDVCMATEPETPAQASPNIQDMSSIMRSWHRNLPPQEQSFSTEPQNKDTPTNTNLSAVIAKDTAKLNQQAPPSSSNLSPNGAFITIDDIPDVARLPTPNSAERDPYDVDNQSSYISESEATQQSLRSRLQEAASEQLRNEIDRAYVNEADVSTEDEQEHSLNNTSLLRETQWHREREEVIRQAKEANESRIIVIQSDNEEEEDEEQEEEPQQTQNYDVDIWQEEASRSTVLDEQQRNQNARETVRTSLERSEQSLSSDKTESKPRSNKVSRSWRCISASDTSYSRGATDQYLVDKISATDPDHVHQNENNSVIASLFRSITGKSQSPIKEQSEKEIEEMQQAEVSTLSKADEFEEGDEDNDTQSLASCNDIGKFRP